jgi:hypothetical protein
MDAANGNGAVRFSIAPKTPAGGSTLVVEDGVFVGPSGTITPEITFTTDGYEDDAEVYYAVVPKGDTPDISDYELLDTVEAGDQRETVTVPLANGDYDIYVIVYKDGEVSEPLIINTTEGGGGVDWEWGDELYRKYYVASYGENSNPGTRAAPVATVQQALTYLAAAYAADASWPEKGTDEERSGGIIILDTVTVTQQINIYGSAGYPPIVLMDDPETPGGKLQTTAAIGSGNNLLRSQSGAKKVTLTGGLVLAGTGNPVDNIRGLYVSDSTFTMDGGEISGNYVSGNGGGVYVYSGTFTMNGGKISGNFATNSGSSHGGGIFTSGTFTMNDGEISGNFTAYNGGGIYNNGYFTMTGGKISGNTAAGSIVGVGGGVHHNAGTFIMTGGEISGNTARGDGNSLNDSYGGGVCIGQYNTPVFEKTGGTIYGYDDADPVNSNKVVNSMEVILNNRGHAIMIMLNNKGTPTHHKEITVGPEDNLTHNYPNTGDKAGW